MRSGNLLGVVSRVAVLVGANMGIRMPWTALPDPRLQPQASHGASDRSGSCGAP